MIRARPAAAAGIALVSVCLLFGQRPATAEQAAPQDVNAAHAAYRQRAGAALDALVALANALEPGREAARRGSARIVAGDDSPGPPLREAAGRLEAAVDEADALAARLSAVRGSTAADGSEPATPVNGRDLRSIASQLRDSATAGEEFATMRHRAAEVGTALDAALRALEAGDTAAAANELGGARERYDVLAAWDPGLVTLPIWLDTTGRLLDAVDDLLAAVDAGDPDAVTAAGEAVAAIGEEAREADVALSLAVSEGGGAIARTPLERLAGVLRRLDDARRELMLIVERGTPLA
jgi:antitoxin (DNA-binding transcriptional repressor) of toxin-antitoxin stability system